MPEITDTYIVKMSHICTVQMLKEGIDGERYRFEYLDNLTVDSLEDLRDELIPKYNEALEARQFAADMIYGRR